MLLSSCDGDIGQCVTNNSTNKNKAPVARLCAVTFSIVKEL